MRFRTLLHVADRPLCDGQSPGDILSARLIAAGCGLTTKRQAYDLTSINEVRSQVDTWRNLPANQCQVTAETGRLLQHWRHHEFGGVRPFFCQIDAVETTIWFTEVAPIWRLASG